MKIIDSIDNVLGKIAKFMAEIGAWLVFVLVLVICYDVFMRYIMNNQTQWGYEMSYIIGCYLACFSITQLMINGGNIRVDLFYVMFPKKVQLIIDLVFSILIFLPAYILLTKSVIYNCYVAYVKHETSTITTWYPLLWPIKAVISLGLVMFCLVFIMITVKRIAELVKEFKKGKGAQENAAG